MAIQESTTNRRRKHSAKHGLCDTSEYFTWRMMKQRCYSPSNKDYPNYGGRGIAVCDRWRYDFPAFLSDMGPRPSDQHSLDRVNNGGDYEPKNCKWSTKAEQSVNRRMSRLLTFQGRTMTMTEWSRKLGLGYAIRHRLNKGWTVERALSKPRLGKNGKPL